MREDIRDRLGQMPPEVLRHVVYSYSNLINLYQLYREGQPQAKEALEDAMDTASINDLHMLWSFNHDPLVGTYLVKRLPNPLSYILSHDDPSLLSLYDFTPLKVMEQALEHDSPRVVRYLANEYGYGLLVNAYRHQMINGNYLWEWFLEAGPWLRQHPSLLGSILQNAYATSGLPGVEELISSIGFVTQTALDQLRQQLLTLPNIGRSRSREQFVRQREQDWLQLLQWLDDNNVAIPNLPEEP